MTKKNKLNFCKKINLFNVNKNCAFNFICFTLLQMDFDVAMRQNILLLSLNYYQILQAQSERTNYTNHIITNLLSKLA